MPSHRMLPHMAWHPLPPLTYSMHFHDMLHTVKRQRALGYYIHTRYHEVRVLVLKAADPASIPPCGELLREEKGVEGK